MHIDHEIKLDFKDVLIRPKRSALPSRAEVDITRKFSFKHSASSYSGVPVIAANMDTVGTFEMARAFAPFGLSVALHKHYSIDDAVCALKKILEIAVENGQGPVPHLARQAPGDSAQK